LLQAASAARAVRGWLAAPEFATGPAATMAMTYIAMQEQLDGKTVNWLEQVSDEQYPAR